MINMIRIVESALVGEIETKDAIDAIHDMINESQDRRSIFKDRCGYRLLIRFKQLQQRSISIKDFAVSLRQFILFNHVKIRVSDKIADGLTDIASEFGLFVDVDNEVQASLNIPKWFKQKDYFNKCYGLEDFTPKTYSLGDNLLMQLASYDKYKSFPQKFSIYNALEMPEGHTLLASLPTGAGKSMIGQMLSYLSLGISIVVVPTVALAIDQLRASMKLFEKGDMDKPPRAYYSGMEYSEKRELINEIKDNKISIIYISPESLVNSQFSEAIMDAAYEGFIHNLIVDEAHLVVDWGEYFRTEFQLLSIFRYQLMEASNNKLRTVLLSATFTDNAVSVLKEIFSEDDKWIEIRSDSLRNEIMYCVDVNKDPDVRKKHILELIHLLPRPLILYVITREDARTWIEIFKENGFSNIEMFTGETKKQDRERVIELWAEDELDLIVATSAFGMGVDKPDVRTVLHGCIPESPNRFYQEVGRGGRDGLSSLSIISTFTTEDKKIANDLTKSRVLNTNTIVSRWESMYESRVPVLADSFWIDTTVKPKHYSEDQKTGLTNSNWNEYVVLFLTRHKFISLIDFIYDTEKRGYQIQVRISNFELLNSSKFLEWLQSKRDYERNLVNEGLDKMKKLIDRPYRSCWSYIFNEIYPLADENCNGCPYCQRYNLNEFLCQLNIKKIDCFLETSYPANKSKISNFMGTSRDMWIYFEEMNLLQMKEKLMKLYHLLQEMGAYKFIVPNFIKENWNSYKSIFKELTKKKHMVFTMDELHTLMAVDNNLLLKGTFVLLYSKDIHENDTIFNKTTKLLDYNPQNRVIHISHDNLYISSRRKDIIEIIEGYSYQLDSFIEEGKNVI